MPTKQDYDTQFAYAASQFDNPDFKTRTEASDAYYKAKKQLVIMHTDLTMGITQIWKSEFAAIKAHNDQMQRDLKTSYLENLNHLTWAFNNTIKSLKK